MSRASTPLVRVPVGVVVARRKAVSQWIDFTWTPVAVLDGVPEAKPWQVLREDGDTTTFYAGSAEIELYRSETPYYRDNLATGAPSLWVVMASASARQFNTRFQSGLSSENVGTSISNRSPLSLTIW